MKYIRRGEEGVRASDLGRSENQATLGLVPAAFSCVCANVVILSLVHVPATRPCYMSPQCVLNEFLSLQHVAATCPCNITRRVYPP